MVVPAWLLLDYSFPHWHGHRPFANPFLHKIEHFGAGSRPWPDSAGNSCHFLAAETPGRTHYLRARRLRACVDEIISVSHSSLLKSRKPVLLHFFNLSSSSGW
jgi:hypothetical protein